MILPVIQEPDDRLRRALRPKLPPRERREFDKFIRRMAQRDAR